jgi:hypothetical protein
MKEDTELKTVSASRVKCPSLLTDVNLTCTGCSACAVSDMWHISVTPLQCEGKYVQEAVSALRVKCPLLLCIFDQICTVFGACVGRGTYDI